MYAPRSTVRWFQERTAHPPWKTVPILAAAFALGAVGLAMFGLFYGVCLHDFHGSTLYFVSASIAFGFFILSTHMHENHFFHFFPLISLVWFLDARLRRIYLILSLTFLANMALHDPYLTAAFHELSIGPSLSLPSQTVPPADVLESLSRQDYADIALQAKGDSSLGWLLPTIINSQVNVLVFAYWLFVFCSRGTCDDPEGASRRIRLSTAAVLSAALVIASGTHILRRAFRNQGTPRTQAFSEQSPA
jgi:hypothetical protein